MNIKYTLKTALKALQTNKSRTGLTILGIVIGITAIMMVMSLGAGAQNLILGEIQSIGPKTIAILPGREPKGPTDFAGTLSDSLKEKDLVALEKKENVPHLAKIMPLVFGSETASYGSETYRPTIFGVTNFFAEIYNITPEEGDIFTDDDVKSRASVVVIGSKVKENLFGGDDALNQKIKIKERNFRVIGVIGSQGQSGFVNFDDAVIVPYSTAQTYILGIKYFNRVVVEADSESTVTDTVKDIENTLRESHNITDPSKDDFFVQTQAQALATVGAITSALTLFLAAVAAISLLVGGVGIMNIMLVSVTERTREIGLRKALGATKKDILTQFLFESITLTATGGLVGIILGSSFSFLISLALRKVYALDWTFSFPVTAALLGLGVASFVGLVFGLYPARQAASKSPIEALRYE